MTRTLTQGSLPAARTAATPLARPYWNPYFVGVLLGLVLLATYAVTGRGLGAIGAFGSVAAWLVSLVSPEHAASNPALSKYFNDGAPLQSWTLFLLIGVFVGALASAAQAHRLRWTVDRGSHISNTTRLAFAFGGGLVAAYGAKIAKGCTSGQALSGGAILNVGSLVFMLAVFAGAYALAWFIRKEWL